MRVQVCAHRGVRGRLRMWCEARRELSIAVRVPAAPDMEEEHVVSEDEAASLVALIE